MARVSLEFRVVDENGAELYQGIVDDLPGDVWEAYAKNAKELMPERREKAWAAMLVSHIRNVARRGKRAFILSDIDEGAADAVGELFARMNISFTGIMARLFASAETGKLHVLNYVRREKDERKPGDMHMVLVTGYENDWWDELAKSAQKMPSILDINRRMSGEELLSEILMRTSAIKVEVTHVESAKTSDKRSGDERVEGQS